MASMSEGLNPDLLSSRSPAVLTSRLMVSACRPDAVVITTVLVGLHVRAIDDEIKIDQAVERIPEAVGGPKGRRSNVLVNKPDCPAVTQTLAGRSAPEHRC